MGFLDINFEYTDAQEERIYAPDLIESAFVDINGITESIFKANKYIVYGPKGAGKSALASKLKFMSEGEWDFFCDVDDLEEFEFSLLKETSGVSGDNIGGNVNVWKFLLYIRILSLYEDNNYISDSSSSIGVLFSELKKYGFLSSKSLVQVVQETSRKGLYTKFSNTVSSIQSSFDKSSDFKVKDPAGLVEAIELALKELSNIESKHYLIIDGLDYLLRDGKGNAGYLVDLIAATRQVNNTFSQLKNESKVIVLFRDEVLDFLPDPNLTKRINDNGIALDWYDKEGNPFDSYLLKVIENRAKIAGFDKNIRELWKSWFPIKIGKKDSILFVLDSTRYLPRDVISFFRAMQSLRKEPPFDAQDVYSALTDYSEWFSSELSDALVGLLDEEVRTSISGILSDIGPRFSVSGFKQSLLDDNLKEESAEKILSSLFNTSWIGNIWYKYESPRYAWKHRREKAVFSARKNCIVHNGLLRALNLR
ncbi:TPA: hypothetical protein PXP09_001974 [Yersinia enterocolitica]|nr:hypothetical protein [Yersinia enterocolitica]HDL7660149.1 hypothetical protein [Yersinia enterocolitica]HDL7662214.1 hypothetical protein [Yersinia enterocolitica]HEN3286911.1 hypothetical protein [Yersinia enterocolitica]